MKILVTGFEPFGGEAINPAQQIVESLPETISGAQVVKKIVPCVFGEAIKQVRQAMEQERPDIVVCIGQSGGRQAICPERVAINLRDARIPDNRGNQPVDEPSPLCPSRLWCRPSGRKAFPPRCPTPQAPMYAMT